MDSGFARAQRAYDAQEPPDHTEAFERYGKKYLTDENQQALADAIADSAGNLCGIRNVTIIESLVTAILAWLNGEDGGDVLDWMAEAKVIPVAFADYTDDEEDDGPDPDRERDEAMDREYDREPF